MQMAEALPWSSAATATSFGLSGSVVAYDMALSDGVTANVASPASTRRAGVLSVPIVSGDCSLTLKPAAAYSPSAAAT